MTRRLAIRTMSQRSLKSVAPRTTSAVVTAIIVLVLVTVARPAFAGCKAVNVVDAQILVDPSVRAALSTAGLSDGEFLHVMRVVSRFETGGCWAGAAGNADGQSLSVGVMQWNFGQKTLQPILARYVTKFPTPDAYVRERDRLMPTFGAKLFDHSCLALQIEPKCKTFLNGQYANARGDLTETFRQEVDQLFESDVMRQIQADYFGRSLTTVIDDLSRIFQEQHPAAWQVAWAMDLKTQQGRFPKDKDIKQVRQDLQTLDSAVRKTRLSDIVGWYGYLCNLYSDGVITDCEYNRKLWDSEIKGNVAADREETVHFTFLISRDAQGQYQADAFQRRATIAFGKGSVHHTVIDFSLQP